MPLFSVVIPVYNTHGYLEDCLESVEAQTCQDFEVILVDDGSTDESGEICDRYAQSHANVCVIHKDNEGLLLARREGMGRACGRYIISLDADDALRSDALEILAKVITESNSDVIGFFFSNREDYSQSSSSTSLQPGSYEADDMRIVKAAALGGTINNLCNKAIKRECIDLDCDYSEFAGLMHGEDLFQLLPILDKAATFYQINVPLYFYRLSPVSSTASYKDSQLLDISRVFERALYYEKLWNASGSGVQSLVINHCYWILLNLASSNLPSKEIRIRENEIRGLLLSYVSNPMEVFRARDLRIDTRIAMSLFCKGFTNIAGFLFVTVYALSMHKRKIVAT